jgi:hypothetical protein
MKIAYYLEESALVGPERTRLILLEAFGSAPSLESIIQVYLSEPDPSVVADSLVSATLALKERELSATGQVALPLAVEINSPRGELPLASPSSPPPGGDSD